MFVGLQPAVLGLPSIRQWGKDAECVCSCCYLALCCCKSSEPPVGGYGADLSGQLGSGSVDMGSSTGAGQRQQEQSVDVYVYA